MTQKVSVCGVLLLDKPFGISSQQAVSKAKYLLKSPNHDSKKAGHTGTLDPMATGLLPICFGAATKFAGIGLDAQKSYHATIALGASTDTGDKEGAVVACVDVAPFCQEALDAIAGRFLGEQWQTPPMYSALKQNGKKLYELARLGIEVDRPARRITITRLSLTKIDNQHITLQVQCSKGTYVRVLGQDIACALGTLGYLTSLRRVATGGLTLDRAIMLEAFADLSFDERLDCLLPADCLLSGFATLCLPRINIERLLLGQRLNIQPAPDAQTSVRIYDDAGQFFGMAEHHIDGKLQPRAMGWF